MQQPLIFHEHSLKDLNFLVFIQHCYAWSIYRYELQYVDLDLKVLVGIV